MCTGVLVSGARDVSGSRLYGGAAGLRSLLAAFFPARMPSASCPSPARAIAAASVAARAGRCGASRCPLLAVALALAICLLSGALQRPLPSAAAAVAAAAAVTTAALASAAAPLLCPTVGRRPAALAALSAPLVEARPTRSLAVSRSRRPLPRPAPATRARSRSSPSPVNNPLAVLRRALFHLPGRRRQWGWCSLLHKQHAGNREHMTSQDTVRLQKYAR